MEKERNWFKKLMSFGKLSDVLKLQLIEMLQEKRKQINSKEHKQHTLRVTCKKKILYSFAVD